MLVGALRVPGEAIPRPPASCSGLAPAQFSRTAATRRAPSSSRACAAVPGAASGSAATLFAQADNEVDAAPPVAAERRYSPPGSGGSGDAYEQLQEELRQAQEDSEEGVGDHPLGLSSRLSRRMERRGRRRQARRAAKKGCWEPSERWQADGAVTVVDTLRALRQMRADVLLGECGLGGDGGPLPAPWRQVVALDCEWQPYCPGERQTRVSLLQIGTGSGRVYLVDCLELCSELPNLLGVAGGRGGGAGGTGGARAAQVGGGCGLLWGRALREEERELSDFLEDLLGDPSIIKVGFHLHFDLFRLAESYPRLPALGGGPMGYADSARSRNNRGGIAAEGEGGSEGGGQRSGRGSSRIGAGGAPPAGGGPASADDGGGGGGGGSFPGGASVLAGGGKGSAGGGRGGGDAQWSVRWLVTVGLEGAAAGGGGPIDRRSCYVVQDMAETMTADARPATTPAQPAASTAAAAASRASAAASSALPPSPSSSSSSAAAADAASSSPGAGTGFQEWCRETPIRSVVDLAWLAGRATRSGAGLSPPRMPLSKLVERVLGLPMDKGQQCSDWGRRPLSSAQVRYAAADVQCLVSIFEVLAGRLLRYEQQQGHSMPDWASGTGQLTSVGSRWVGDVHPSMSQGLQQQQLPDLGASSPLAPPGGSAAATAARSGVLNAPRAAAGQGTAAAAAAAARTTAGGGAVAAVALRYMSSDRVDIDVGAFLAAHLGRAFAEGGRAVAVRHAAAPAPCREPVARAPAFPRGSPLVRWRNAAMLFVDVPADAAGENAALAAAAWRFTDGGRHLEAPCGSDGAAPSGAAAAATAAAEGPAAEAETGPLLLLCRVVDGASRGPYMLLGRAEPAAGISAAPVGSSRLSLLDFEALRSSPGYKHLLEQTTCIN